MRQTQAAVRIFIMTILGFLLLQIIPASAQGTGGDACPLGVSDKIVDVIVFHVVFDDFPDSQIPTRKQKIKDIFPKIEEMTYHKIHDSPESNPCVRFRVDDDNIKIKKFPRSEADKCIDAPKTKNPTGIIEGVNPKNTRMSNTGVFISYLENLLPNNPLKEIFTSASNQRRDQLIIVMFEEQQELVVINGQLGLLVGITWSDIDLGKEGHQPLSIVPFFNTPSTITWPMCNRPPIIKPAPKESQFPLDAAHSAAQEKDHNADEKAGFFPTITFDPHTQDISLHGEPPQPLQPGNLMRYGPPVGWKKTPNQAYATRLGFTIPDTCRYVSDTMGNRCEGACTAQGGTLCKRTGSRSCGCCRFECLRACEQNSDCAHGTGGRCVYGPASSPFFGVTCAPGCTSSCVYETSASSTPGTGGPGPATIPGPPRPGSGGGISNSCQDYASPACSGKSCSDVGKQCVQGTGTQCACKCPTNCEEHGCQIDAECDDGNSDTLDRCITHSQCTGVCKGKCLHTGQPHT